MTQFGRPRWRIALALLVSLLAGCGSLPPGADFPKVRSTASAHATDTRLGRQFDAAALAHGGQSGFRLLAVGMDGFLARAEMIDAAERSIDLQYYIFRQDQTGQLLSEALLRAADRGVHIRLLMDDGDTLAGDERILALGAHPNVDIRIFNPFAYRGHAELFRSVEFVFNASRLDYRMHNKLMVVDNTIALIGGRNIGDQYFQVDPESQFGDDDVFAAGPVAQTLTRTFDDFWNSDLAIPAAALTPGDPSGAALATYRALLVLHRQQLQSAATDYALRVGSGEPLAGMLSGRLPLQWAHAQVISDSPDKRRVESREMVGRLMHRNVAEAVAAVQSELLMVTPYLVPGSDGMALLGALRRRGVAVRILTNSLESTVEMVAQAGYMRYRIPLLEAGVQLYEVRALLGNARGSGESRAATRSGNYGLHAKLFVFDRQRLYIGSMNFDQRSHYLNTEIGLLIDSPELASQTAQRFEAIVASSNSYRPGLRADAANGAPTLVWRTQEQGKEVEYDEEPARGSWQRLKAKFLSLLPLDSEL